MPSVVAKPKRRRTLFPKSRRGRAIFAIVVAAALVGTVAGVWFLTRPTDSPTTNRQVVTVSPTTLKTTVSASGTLEPQRQSDLSFGSSGTVTAVNVAVGDEVTEGEELATIDTSAVDIALQSAEADLAAAEASLSDLEDSDDATDAAINAAAASVQVKQNAVTAAKANVSAATLTAPFAGIVAAVNVAVGDTSGSTSAGSAGGGGTGGGAGGGTTDTSSSSGAITLISRNAFTVSTSVSSSDIASIKRGLQAELSVGGSTETIYGTVESVAVVATSSTSGTSSFPVTIKVTGTPEGLFAGSSVTADIIVSQQADVIAVNAAALTTSDGTSTVTKVVDGVDTVTPVTIGETLNGQVIVTEGLADGDQIVVEMTTPGAGSTSQDSGDTQGFPGQSGGQMPDLGSGDIPSGGMQPPNGQGGQQGGPNR